MLPPIFENGRASPLQGGGIPIFNVGAPGFEPELNAPKAIVLPLHYAPMHTIIKYKIICYRYIYPALACIVRGDSPIKTLPHGKSGAKDIYKKFPDSTLFTGKESLLLERCFGLELPLLLL